MFKNSPTLNYISGRTGWYFLTFLVAVTINFFLPRMGSGNPVDIIMSKVSNPNMDAETRQMMEESYLIAFNLIRVDNAGAVERDAAGQPVATSLWSQFFTYVRMSLKGDLGTSFFKYPKKVAEIIREALPWTLALQIPSILFGYILGNILGALAAYRRGVFDKFFYPLALLISAVPPFCFGILLVYVFGIQLEWFPALGAYDDGTMVGFTWEFFSSASYYYVLPFLSIFCIIVGSQAIGMRSMCIYELGTDYVKYSKLLGIKETKVLYYMFRNAMLPQLTGLALALGMMIGGALITEMIFSYPGLGMAVLTAIQSNDYPLIQGCTLLVTVSVLLANFTIDIIIGFLDPRIRSARTGSGG